MKWIEEVKTAMAAGEEDSQGREDTEKGGGACPSLTMASDKKKAPKRPSLCITVAWIEAWAAVCGWVFALCSQSVQRPSSPLVKLGCG